jgi:plasmid stabilization system protein ParE
VGVLTVGQHLIVYEPHPRGIEVLRVLHQKRAIETALRRRQ